MNSIRKQLIAGLSVAYVAMASVAHAQTPPAAPAAPHEHEHAAMMARMKERMAKHQAELHDKLKLNAQQETAWKAYVAKMQPPAPPARPQRGEWEKLTAPERMDRMLAMSKEHQKHTEERAAATKDFYAVLTPELVTVQSTVSQMTPEQRLGIGLCPAQ